jgi:hypothetical protein
MLFCLSRFLQKMHIGSMCCHPSWDGESRVPALESRALSSFAAAPGRNMPHHARFLLCLDGMDPIVRGGWQEHVGREPRPAGTPPGSERG